MACFIYAETNDPPPDFWLYYKSDDSSKKVIECTINDIEYKVVNKKVGNGFFVRINNKIYIITCSHIIGQNNMKILSYHMDETNGIFTSLVLIKVIEEFDLAILEPVIIPDRLDFVEAYLDKQPLFDTLESEFIINSYIERRGAIGRANIKTTFSKIENINLITEMIKGYELPFFNLRPENQDLELPGTSGSLVTNNGKPVGMVMLADINTKSLHAMPFNIVINIVKSFIKNETKELTVLIFNSDLVADKSEEVINFYGHMITHDFGIKYVTDGQVRKLFAFKEDDIIIALNNNVIESNGNIICKELNLEFKIRTYAMLQFIFKGFVEIKFLRGDKECKIVISGVNPQLYFSYNLQKPKTFLYHDGCIFIELSEDTLKYFKSRKILLFENELAIINTNSKQKKYVVLVSINCNNISRLEDNFPFTNNRLTILKKVGNDDVANLQMLKKILNKKIADKTVTYSYF